MKKILLVFIIVLIGCTKKQSWHKKLNDYAKISNKYKKELAILDAELEYEDVQHDIFDLVLIKYSNSLYPFRHYKHVLEEDIKYIKSMLRHINIVGSSEYYEDIDSLKNQLKIIYKIIVTSEKYRADVVMHYSAAHQ